MKQRREKQRRYFFSTLYYWIYFIKQGYVLFHTCKLQIYFWPFLCTSSFTVLITIKPEMCIVQQKTFFWEPKRYHENTCQYREVKKSYFYLLGGSQNVKESCLLQGVMFCKRKLCERNVAESSESLDSGDRILQWWHYYCSC